MSTLCTGVSVPCSTLGLCCAKSLSSLGSVWLSHCMQLCPAHFSVWKKNEGKLSPGLFFFFSITSGEFAAIFGLPTTPIMICFAWNLSLQVGRMSSYADICGSKHAQGSTEGGYQRYGVRSYLHQFYEDCTASIWEYEDDFQIQRSPSRWSSVFWKVLPVAFFWRETPPFQDFPCVITRIKYSSFFVAQFCLRWPNNCV